MKRLLIAAGLICLLLLGCDSQPPAETSAPTESTPTITTEPAGCYLHGSDLEAQSKGAIRTYCPDLEDIRAIRAVGEDLLVFSGEDPTVLTLLSGENLYMEAQTELSGYVSPEDTAFVIGQRWISYYDAGTETVVYLDHSLKEVSSFPAPEGMVGEPALSPDQRKVYYCTDSAVRVWDLNTEIDRVLKEITARCQYMVGTLLDGTVLCFRISQDEETWSTLYISPETGEILWEQIDAAEVTSGSGHYYTHSCGPTMTENLFGTLDGATQMLLPEDYTAPVWFVEDRCGAMSAAQTENGTLLNYYDLESGLRTSALTVPAHYDLWDIAPAPEGQLYLLFLAEEPWICRWDLAAMATNDTTVYTSPRYTLDAPDEVGLSRCHSMAEDLENRFDVEILLGEEAAAVQPWDYIIDPEYQVPVIFEMLMELESCLEAFPEGFFTTLAEGTASKRVRICLVRQLRGSYESGSLDTATGIQFWDQEDAYVALTLDGSFAYNFYHELFHVIDTRVLSECNSYDTWNTLNPKGFRYDNDYIANQTRDGSAYLGENDRSFIDTYSMSFPKEDRARIMEYACNEGNESYFATVTMQKKLKQLCQGIRKAFGLQKSTEEFLWEQYLDTPIAYQEKK